MGRRITLSYADSLNLIVRYVGVRFHEQFRSSIFIIAYLFIFQHLILGSDVGISLSVIAGVMLVIVGLTLFLEGLVLGLMPLGESVGLKLPQKSRLRQMILFGLIIGIISTLAEPAVATLRSAGSTVLPWEAPLLYMLLEVYPGALVGAVGAGVGIAVAASLIRFHYGLSLKPFVLPSLALVLTATVIYSFHENLRTVIGLAWDTGAVTTGPVTVPLVLALSMGVSRASEKKEGVGGGFGSIALASLVPVAAVMALALIINTMVPSPMKEAEFFQPENRSEALKVTQTEDQLESAAFLRGSEEARRIFYQDEQAYLQALDRLKQDTSVLEGMDLSNWLHLHASASEQQYLKQNASARDAPVIQVPIPEVIREETASSLRAVIPLTGVLLIILLAVLRDKLQYKDEFILGISITLIGMMFLTSGIRLGLLPLGDSVGRQLPRVYQAQHEEETFVLENFDLSLVYEGIDTESQRYQFFYIREGTAVEKVIYDPEHHDRDSEMYRYTRYIPPPFGTGLTAAGMFFVLLFAFGLGYGSTLAEPALSALGRSVEEITVGTVTRTGVIRAVSIGVGAGLVAGVLRILYSIPMMWMLLPVYLLLVPLTLLSDNEFTGISWDSGGVTTGPVTVPLVLAMGLGIGGALTAADGFGILAMASVYPILSVQLYGFIVRLRQRRTIHVVEQESGYE